MNAFATVLLLVLTGLASAAMADDSGSNNGPGSVCYTYTTCADGHQINCQASGNSCTWSYVTNNSVICTGYDGLNMTGAAHTSQMSCR
jgi:hypothetical protein